MIQQVLNVVVSESPNDDLWLRKNIFRTKYTAKGKVCNMIINNGSCENIVSTHMVRILSSNEEDLPEPYQLTWIKRHHC